MALEYRQRGKPTYRYTMTRCVFNEDLLEDLLYDILIAFGERYAPKTKIVNLKVNIHGTWNAFGPSGDCNMSISPKYRLGVGCYYDGWKIYLLDKGNGFSIPSDVKLALFNDINESHMWTQQTDRVVGMMGELYNALKEMGELQ